MPENRWYQDECSEVAEQLGVNPATGLSSSDVKERLEKYGRNKMADPPVVPGWRKFISQYKDFIRFSY